MRRMTQREALVLQWASQGMRILQRQYFRGQQSDWGKALLEYPETKRLTKNRLSRQWLIRDYLPDGTLRRGTLAAYFQEMRELNGKHWRRMDPDMLKRREHRRYHWDISPLWDKLKRIKAVVRKQFPIRNHISMSIDRYIEALEKAA